MIFSVSDNKHTDTKNIYLRKVVTVTYLFFLLLNEWLFCYQEEGTEQGYGGCYSNLIILFWGFKYFFNCGKIHMTEFIFLTTF